MCVQRLGFQIELIFTSFKVWLLCISALSMYEMPADLNTIFKHKQQYKERESEMLESQQYRWIIKYEPGTKFDAH